MQNEPRENRNAIAKQIWKAIGYGALFIVLLFLGQFVGIALMELLFPVLMLMNEDAAETLFMYGSYIGCCLLIVGGIFLIKPLRPIRFAIARKPRGNNLRFSIWGLALGFVLNGLCVGAAVLHGDIQLLWERFDLMPILLLFVAVFLQCAAEELLCRAVLYQLTARITKKPYLLFSVNALVFALLHTLNPGVTVLSLVSIALLGILMSVMVYHWDSLWAAFAFHTAWNFSQSIIWGLPNSGQTEPYHVMRLTEGSAKDSLFYNVGFGIEATWFVVLLLAIAVIAIVLRRRKHIQQPTDVWTV